MLRRRIAVCVLAALLFAAAVSGRRSRRRLRQCPIGLLSIYRGSRWRLSGTARSSRPPDMAWLIANDRFPRLLKRFTDRLGQQAVHCPSGIMLLVPGSELALDDPNQQGTSIRRRLHGDRSQFGSCSPHTSGLVRESPAFTPLKNLSDAELVNAVHAVPLRSSPGLKWEYSNIGYVALAEIIHRVTQQPWTEFLSQRVSSCLRA